MKHYIQCDNVCLTNTVVSSGSGIKLNPCILYLLTWTYSVVRLIENGNIKREQNQKPLSLLKPYNDYGIISLLVFILLWNYSVNHTLRYKRHLLFRNKLHIHLLQVWGSDRFRISSILSRLHCLYLRVWCLRAIRSIKTVTKRKWNSYFRIVYPISHYSWHLTKLK